jgi:hypothetical protein
MWVRQHSKQILLTILALGVIGLALWPDLPAIHRQVLAQQQSPFATPTWTPTFNPFAPFTPTPTWTPTPGPTATKVKRVINEIREPRGGDAIAGTVRIIGTALTEAFQRYDMHISPASKENWQWLTTNYQVVHDDLLYVLDTTDFPDGYYDLRVRSIDDTGNYTEAYARNLEIRNANPPTRTPLPPGTPPPPESPLVTPTPTVDVSSRVSGGQGFYAPDNGAVLRGPVSIVATVNGTPDNPFARYELAISPAGQEGWLWLDTSARQAWQQPIYALDTTELPDGLYDLRLRIVYRDANYDEYFLRNLSVANTGQPLLAFAPPAGIAQPHGGNEVGGVVEFTGTVPAADLLKWELAWSPAQTEQWQFLVSAENPVANDVIARLDLSRLPNGLYDFRLRVVRSDTNYTDYFVRDLRVNNGPGATGP